MTDIYYRIVQKFDFLKSWGLNFKYSESKGKLNDRNIQKFTYDNPTLGKKFEIVFCTTSIYPKLYGFLVKYKTQNNNSLDSQNFISFDRLRCFFEEGGDIIFFGNEQYDISYKLKEFKSIIEKFRSCVTSNEWVDYHALLSHERRIYALTLEPENYYTWTNEIKESTFVKYFTNIIYDASIEPPYEAYELRLKSKNGIEFHITHGYKSRDDVGFSVKVIQANNKSESHEFINTGANKVVEFIKQMVCT